MYIRKQKVGEKVYFQLVEKIQEGDRKRLRVICHLGKDPSLEAALIRAKERGDEEMAGLLENFMRVTKGVTKIDGVTKGVTKEITEGVTKIGRVTKAGETKSGETKSGETKSGVTKPTPKRLPWKKIRAVDTDGIPRTVGPNPVGAVFSEKSLEVPPKRRFRPRPIPEEAQRIIGEISELMASRADDELIIEKVKELLQVSRCGPRHWLKWVDRERLDHLLKEARKRIPRRVKENKGPGPYDVLPPPPEGETWGKSYWTRLTMELLEKKIRGDVGAREICKRLFPHYWKTQRIGLTQASLVYSLLKDRPDRSLDSWEFHQMYQAADYAAMVFQLKRRGRENASTRLTEEQVKEIRERYARGVATYRVLAEDYGTSTENVYQIVKGRTWKVKGG
jgi:hypothetical protein